MPINTTYIQQLQKSILHFVYLFISIIIISSCTDKPENKHQNNTFSQDTSRINTLTQKASELLTSLPDTSYKHLQEALKLAEAINFNKGRMKITSVLGNYFLQKAQYDSAIYYSSQALSIANELNSKLSQASQLIEIANIYYYSSKYDTALSTLTKAKELIAALDNDKLDASFHNLSGNINNSLGHNQDALNAYLKAAAIYEELKNELALAVVYNNLGNVFRSIGNKNKAIENWEKAVLINLELNNHFDLAMNYGNLGVMYLETDSSTNALRYFKEAIRYAKKSDGIQLMAQNYLNLGNTYKELENYLLAERFYDSAMIICSKHTIGYGVLLVNINSGDLSTLQGNYEIAEQKLQDALREAQNMKLKDEEKGIYLSLYKLYKAKGQFGKALTYNEKYHNLNDSINANNNSKVIQELIEKSEKEKRDKEIVVLNSHIKSAKQSRMIIAISSLLLILALVMLVYFLISARRKAQYEKTLIEKENENLNLSKELAEQDLTINALNLARTSEIINSINKRLLVLKESASGEIKQSISAMIHSLQKESNSEPFQEFVVRFENQHQKFYSLLSQKYPQLSSAEIKLCGYLRMNMSTKDIAALTNRSIRTIETHRYNIRTKLGITTEKGLINFLLSV